MPKSKGNGITRREVLQRGGLVAGAAMTGGRAPLAASASTASGQAPELCFKSALELARLLRGKHVSAREVLDAHLRQIERVNPKVNAIVTLVADLSLIHI